MGNPRNSPFMQGDEAAMFGLFFDRFYARWENGGTPEAVTAAFNGAFEWVRGKLEKDPTFSTWYAGFKKLHPRLLAPVEMSEILGRAKMVLDRRNLYEWPEVAEDDEPHLVEQTLSDGNAVR